MKLIIVATAALALLGLACRDAAESNPQIPVHPKEARGLPVLWLGEAFELNGVTHKLVYAELSSRPPTYFPDGSVLAPGVRNFTLGYGECVIPEGASGCPVPITIIIEHPCDAKVYAPESELRDTTVRGVPAKHVGLGSLWAQTNDFSITVHAPGATTEEVEGNARAVMEALYGANPEAAQFGKTTAFNARVQAHMCR